jgi:hypothetical protein
MRSRLSRYCTRCGSTSFTFLSSLPLFFSLPFLIRRVLNENRDYLLLGAATLLEALTATSVIAAPAFLTASRPRMLTSTTSERTAKEENTTVQSPPGKEDVNKQINKEKRKIQLLLVAFLLSSCFLFFPVNFFFFFCLFFRPCSPLFFFFGVSFVVCNTTF